MTGKWFFCAGPRQVGKTTLAKATGSQLSKNFHTLNWDNEDDQMLILKSPAELLHSLHLNILKQQAPIILFDELHKYKNWRNYLKGFYDKYFEDIKFILTGSAKLDTFRVTGDSLMGRYFHIVCIHCQCENCLM